LYIKKEGNGKKKEPKRRGCSLGLLLLPFLYPWKNKNKTMHLNTVRESEGGVMLSLLKTKVWGRDQANYLALTPEARQIAIYLK